MFANIVSLRPLENKKKLKRGRMKAHADAEPLLKLDTIQQKIMCV